MNKILKNVKKTFSSTGLLYIILFVALGLYSLFLVYLLLWGTITSLKDISEFNDNVLGFPKSLTFSNYEMVFKSMYVKVPENGALVTKYIEDMLINTALYTIGGAFILTFVPCVVAYVAAKYDFKFNGVIKTIVIVTMVLPIIGAAPSEIQLLRDIGLYDSIIGNWIQKFNFLGMYFLIFLSTFEMIPNDYAEAAYIDGASEFRVLSNVMLPMVKNIFITVFLINFIGLWNDYQVPMMYLPSHPTLAYGVFYLSRTTIKGLNNVPSRMTACLILLVPVLTIFIAFRKKIMGNINLGGIKE